ncbi:hypothetical protein B484DRAFT_250362 [Ochromonadaceae sp. CCMP2298]|nr:hypothetical protein B484DRAFT_250362 [Ochromonadaceae sp. CCMP2298]
MRGLDEDDVALLMQSGALAGNVRNSNINDVRNGGNTGKNGKKGKNGRFGMGAVGGAAEGVALPAGMLDIKRLSDGNIAEPSSGSISAVDFHPRGDVLMVAGADRHVRLFHVDGDRNERQASVKIQDMPVVSGFFRGGGTGYTSSEVVLAGRKPYFYCYDVQGGGMSKIPGPMGLVDAGPAAKSLEHMVQSPGGELLAFRAASGGWGA